MIPYTWFELNGKHSHTHAVRSHDVSRVGNVFVVYIVQHMYLRTLVTVTHTSTVCFIDEKSLSRSHVRSSLRCGWRLDLWCECSNE